jgi:hypothetical protein
MGCQEQVYVTVAVVIAKPVPNGSGGEVMFRSGAMSVKVRALVTVKPVGVHMV